MNKISCVILAYEITKGMKSYGPLSLLKSLSAHSKELILYQIDSLYKLFDDPDISIVCGFGMDKIVKKIPSNINIVYNEDYDKKNHGHAIKLIWSLFDYHKYDGLFILDGNTLLTRSIQTVKLDKNNSWIISKKIKKSDSNNKFVGSVMKDNAELDYIFYDVGSSVWCNSVFFSHEDIRRLTQSNKEFYDNMFLFEIINKSVALGLVNYNNLVIPHNSAIMIEGMKDKNKIKEII